MRRQTYPIMPVVCIASRGIAMSDRGRTGSDARYRISRNKGVQ